MSSVSPALERDTELAWISGALVATLGVVDRGNRDIARELAGALTP